VSIGETPNHAKFRHPLTRSVRDIRCQKFVLPAKVTKVHKNTLRCAHAYSAPPHPTRHAYTHQPNPPPGLAHWVCIQKASALGSRVGWTHSPAVTNKQTTCYAQMRLIVPNFIALALTMYQKSVTKLFVHPSVFWHPRGPLGQSSPVLTLTYNKPPLSNCQISSCSENPATIYLLQRFGQCH